MGVVHPNCAYFNNPSKPVDLLGRPIKVGDFVAIATLRTRSANMTVGPIDKITFKRRVDGEWFPCPPAAAEKYTITVEVYQTTGYRYGSMRTTTLQNVEKVVRLDLPPGQPENLVNP